MFTILKKSTLFLVMFVLFCNLNFPSGYCGWITEIRKPGDPLSEYIGIRYDSDSIKGHKTIKCALLELSDKEKINNLSGLNISELLESDTTFQKEIFSELRLNNSPELDEALRSSGNIHNPKIRALYAPFTNAVLHTTLVKRVNAELKSFGLKIVEVSPEKLAIKETRGKKYFIAILYLAIGQK
jgi:hypothetical protein